jgi:hypothetical protein
MTVPDRNSFTNIKSAIWVSIEGNDTKVHMINKPAVAIQKDYCTKLSTISDLHINACVLPGTTPQYL